MKKQTVRMASMLLVIILLSGIVLGSIPAVAAAEVIYELKEPADGAVNPEVVTGDNFTVEMVVNAAEFTNEYGLMSLVVGKNSAGNDVAFQLSKTNISALSGVNDIIEPIWGINLFLQNLNNDMTLKLVVEGATWTAYVNGGRVWTATDDRLLVTKESKLSVASWEVKLSIKSMKITKSSADASKLPYELEAPVSGGVAPGIYTGNEFVAELVLHTTEVINKQYGNVQLIVGRNRLGNEVKFVMNAENIFALNGENDFIAADWGNTLLVDNVKQDVKLKLVVEGATWTLFVNNEQMWTTTNDLLYVADNSEFSIAGWESKFEIKSLKITGKGGSAEVDPDEFPDEPVDYGPIDLGELGSNTATGDTYYYNDFNGGAYKGSDAKPGQERVPFTLDKAYAFHYELETVLNVSEIKKENGRGIRIDVRANPLAGSGALEVWISHNSIWACSSIGWVGHMMFDFTPYMNRDVKVRLTVNRDMLTMYLDGYPVWSAQDTSFLVGSQGKISIGGWDANLQIKEIKVSPIGSLSDEVPELKEQYEYVKPQMGGTTYYVDANASPGGNGKSPEKAWKTIQQVNNHGAFLPGDRILFKRGCKWEGVTLAPQGYGIEGHPIIIDSYGEGALPIIDRNTDFTQENNTIALQLKDQSYWTIRNIQISNQNAKNPGFVEDPTDVGSYVIFPQRNGIVISASYKAGYKKNTVKGIVIENVVFANIYGSGGDEASCYKANVGFKDAWSGSAALGISAQDVESGESRAYIDGVIVRNCTFRNISGTGISVASGWTYYDSFHNLVIKDNRFYNEEGHDTTFGGIYVVSATRPLVDSNMMYNMAGGAAFQICEDAVAQNNVIVDVDGYMHISSRLAGRDLYWDGCGLDADTNCLGTTIFRNNYIERAHAGSFAFFDYNETLPAKILLENNVSYNSSTFLYYQCSDRSYTFDIRNNTIIRMPDSPCLGWDENVMYEVVRSYVSTPNPETYSFTGNIFYFPEQEMELYNDYSIFYRNAYIGIKDYPYDSSAVTADPMLKLPASLEETANMSMNGSIKGTISFLESGLFRVSEDSPCFNGQTLICGVDFDYMSGDKDAVEAPDDSQIPSNPVAPQNPIPGDPDTGNETEEPTDSSEEVPPPTQSDADPNEEKPTSGGWAWIVVAILVPVGGTIVAFILIRKKSTA